MTAEEFIANNLAPIMGLLFLLMTIVKNDTMDLPDRKLFLHIWIFELLELTAYNLELVTASYDHPTNMRIFLSALGYSLRPLIPYILIKLIKRVEDKKIYEVLLILPWVLAVILSFSAFFTDIAYSYDAQNVFHRGPLGYFCQVITVLYMFILMIRAIRSHIFEKRIESKVMLLVMAYITVAMVLEAAFGIRSIGRTSMVYSTVFFMFALQTNKLRKMIPAVSENEALKNALADVERAKQEAERANAAKSRFLSRMSHDIRTPLNGIIGILEINSKCHDEQIEQENRDKAMVAANHLLSLINDVLEMSKLDDENTKLEHTAFDLKALTEDVLVITGMRAAEEGITLVHSDCFSQFQYPYVYGSPLHVRQIFLNIFSNAIKYNKPSGQISCKVMLEGNDDKTVHYRCIIADTGIGMSKDYLEHIFEPFSQEESDTRTSYRGTGLGMAIVKTLIDKMGGTIDIQSEPNVGTTFTVSLPFEIASVEDVHTITDDETKADISGMKLLIVEDNELNLEIAKYLLEDAGAVTDTAADGEQAVKKFTQSPEGTYDAILMDIMMPVMDGYAATKAIREYDRPDAKTIPIIAMTANAFAEDVLKCKSAGMNDHLAKPLVLDTVMKTLAKYKAPAKAQ